MTENKNTQISDLGEFGLIEYLTKNIKIRHKSTIKGVGDDAAVIKPSKRLVVTTDMLLEGVHFDLTYVPLKHLGYKAVAVNVSDVCAMNAIPKQITVSIGISSKFSLEAIDMLYQGIYLACEKYNIDLIGGDTCSSLTGLTISITAIGEANDKEIAYRNGAKSNDLICLSGNLGASYMGLQLLEREKMVFNTDKNMKPQFDGYEYILERQLKPEARIDIIEKLKEKSIIPTSMIDISDGLSSELNHICNQSDKGCVIFEEKIPIHAITRKMAKEMNMEPMISVLNGGEDYELLFTIPLEEKDKIAEINGITVIGYITDDKETRILTTKDNNKIQLSPTGWNAFSN